MCIALKCKQSAFRNTKFVRSFSLFLFRIARHWVSDHEAKETDVFAKEEGSHNGLLRQQRKR